MVADDCVRMTEDGYQTLYSKKYKQTYHSVHGVLQEAQQVFIDGCGIEQTLQKQAKISILEVGFGTGFNFLLSASRALENGKSLDYTALENDLLAVDILKSLNHHRLPHVRPIWEKMISGLEKVPVGGRLKILFKEKISLTLLLGDAAQSRLKAESFDALYLDAFSPGVNPELWQEEFFNKLYRALKPNGVLATYSSKGTVRRSLQSVGFDVLKRPGPAGKREIISAVKKNGTTRFLVG